MLETADRLFLTLLIGSLSSLDILLEKDSALLMESFLRRDSDGDGFPISILLLSEDKLLFVWSDEFVLSVGICLERELVLSVVLPLRRAKDGDGLPISDLLLTGDKLFFA